MITITEALAEIKTIKARIAKKREAVIRYFARDGRIIDPLQSDGGTPQFIARETQAITDLQERIVTLRAAIQHANATTHLAINGIDRSVGDWLTWRREIAPDAKSFLEQQAASCTAARSHAEKQGWAVRETMEGSGEKQVLIGVNEVELVARVDRLEEILGVLDGKLSLLNATTMIDV